MSDEVIYSASWLINPDAPPLAGGALLVRNGNIVDTGSLQLLRSKYPAQVIDYPGFAILPGFINAHTHLELTHYPAWLQRTSSDCRPNGFSDWIIQFIKVARGLSPTDYPTSIQEGIRMCLESGTTSVGEIVANPALARHYYNSSLAGRLYFEILGQETSHFESKLTAALAAATEDPERAFLSGLSPHSPYTIAEQHLQTIREASTSHNQPLAIHLSESRSEVDFLFDGSGLLASNLYPFVGWERFLGQPTRCSSTALLDRHGLLTRTTLAIHCVHVSIADARVLKSRGVHIALCPRSNDILDVGRAPVALFKKVGIPLALGTDSLASNNSLSLWDELRFALDTFPDDISEQDVLRMVTKGAADALGVSATSGSLESGKRADFQVIDCHGSGGDRILERVMREGVLKELFVCGVRYGETI